MFSPKSTNLRSKKAGIGMESKALYLRQNSSYFFIFLRSAGRRNTQIEFIVVPQTDGGSLPE